MENGIQCINKLSSGGIVNTTQNFQNKVYMLQASHFRGQEINAISSITLLFCEMWVTNKESDLVY